MRIIFRSSKGLRQRGKGRQIFYSAIFWVSVYDRDVVHKSPRAMHTNARWAFYRTIHESLETNGAPTRDETDSYGLLDRGKKSPLFPVLLFLFPFSQSLLLSLFLPLYFFAFFPSFFYFLLSLTLSLSLSPFRSFRSPYTTHFSFIAVALSPPASPAFPFLRPHLCASSSPDSARGTRRQYNTQKSRLASHLRFLFLPDLQPRNSPPIFALFTQPPLTPSSTTRSSVLLRHATRLAPRPSITRILFVM